MSFTERKLPDIRDLEIMRTVVVHQRAIQPVILKRLNPRIVFAVVRYAYCFGPGVVSPKLYLGRKSFLEPRLQCIVLSGPYRRKDFIGQSSPSELLKKWPTCLACADNLTGIPIDKAELPD